MYKTKQFCLLFNQLIKQNASSETLYIMSKFKMLISVLDRFLWVLFPRPVQFLACTFLALLAYVSPTIGGIDNRVMIG